MKNEFAVGAQVAASKGIPTDWAARKAQAAAEKAAAEALLTDEKKIEIADRAVIAQDLADAERARRVDRDLQIERALDHHRELLGPSAKIAAVTFDSRLDFFIVKPDAKAHVKWEQEIASGKKHDRVAVNCAYAMALVIQWNQIDDFAVGNLNGGELLVFLQRNPAMLNPLVNEGARLAGFLAEERKS